ncbi:MAG: serine/threonine protein kinase [bacterium]|nr:serine/threonine protein kinase [bacterium]
MSHGSLDRLAQLLDATLERSVEDRGPFLDQECDGEPELRRAIEDLLASYDDAADYFGDLVNDIVASSPQELESATQTGIQIGPYRTLVAIGHGGMGAVYRAERIDGSFDQEVALKLLHLDMETPQLRARFVAERQLLAGLSHPNIAHLLDGGVSEEGRPYFVMEIVEGLPITRHCEQNRSSIDTVLRLFLDVVDAVSYLHRNLVVHRDLKPGNIFVDGNGQVKLLDFGIAKLLADAPEESENTRTGQLLMTPEYAAPEQLLGAAVTTATDVYALGVVLFELLTGERPHDRSNWDPKLVSRQMPPTPNAKLRSRSQAEGTPLTGQASRKTLPGVTVAWSRIDHDLETVCLKALNPDPERRYASAEQLGQDIERFLGGMPVQARRSTLPYRMGKFVQRHRAGVLATAGLLVLITAGFVQERVLRNEAELARSDAQQQAVKAEAVSDFLAELLSSVDPKKAQGDDVAVADVLEQAAVRLDEGSELAELAEVEAAVRLTIGNTYVSLGEVEKAKDHLERAVELHGGRDSIDLEALEAIASLAVAYQQLGLFDEGEGLLLRVIEARVEILGEEHPSSLMAMNQLADLYWTAGRYDEVEPIDRRVLEVRRRVLGDDHPDTLRSINALAAGLFNRGQLSEAAELFEQALESRQRQLGTNHPDTLMLVNNLAAAHTELGNYQRAETLLRSAIVVRVKVLGEEHVDTAMSLHNLGVLLAQVARYDEAEQQLQRAIASRQNLPGAGYKASLFSKSHLADVYRAQGRFADAERLYVSTLEEQREKFGLQDKDTLRTAAGLAFLKLQQGDLVNAERMISEASKIQMEVLGEENFDTIGSQITLARIRSAQGRFEEAQKLSERAVEIGTQALGPNHPVVLSAELERARALAGQQQYQLARGCAVLVYEARAKLLGQEHPDTIEAQDFLGILREDQAASSVKQSAATTSQPNER